MMILRWASQQDINLCGGHENLHGSMMSSMTSDLFAMASAKLRAPIFALLTSYTETKPETSTAIHVMNTAAIREYANEQSTMS